MHREQSQRLTRGSGIDAICWAQWCFRLWLVFEHWYVAVGCIEGIEGIECMYSGFGDVVW
jgi:hypothetical protein